MRFIKYYLVAFMTLAVSLTIYLTFKTLTIDCSDFCEQLRKKSGYHNHERDHAIHLANAYCNK